MPDERDIEKGLRAWARRRREEAGAPVELHPATRRLLQAEAARLKSRGRGSLARWLWGSPLRLALNLSAMAMLVIVAAFLLPQSRHAPVAVPAGREVIAENIRKEAVETPLSGSPLNLVEAEKDSRDDTSKAKSNGNAIYLGDKLTVAKKETAPPSAMPGAAPSTATFDQELVPNNSPPTQSAAQAVASAAPPATAKMPAAAPAPPPVVQRLFWANSPTNASAQNEPAVRKSGAVPVLASFRTEQTGNRLRVIDADGSVYTGVLAAAPARQQASDGVISPVQSRSFRVTGTNVTSHQRIVFTGRLVLGAQSQPVASYAMTGGAVDANGTTDRVGGGGGFGGGGSYYKTEAGTNGTQTNTSLAAGTALQSSAAHGVIPPQPQFRIEGTLRIGTNQIPVNAISTAR
jgi:hypothetical protein